jgi:hypothetical protein
MCCFVVLFCFVLIEGDWNAYLFIPGDDFVDRAGFAVVRRRMRDFALGNDQAEFTRRDHARVNDDV